MGCSAMVKQIELSVLFIMDQWLNRCSLSKEPTIPESSAKQKYSDPCWSMGFTYTGDKIVPDAL
jgi:hypothetical protein